MTKDDIPQTQKRYKYSILAVLLSGILGLTFFVCSNVYENDRREYMQEQNGLALRDAQNALLQIRSWQESLLYQTSILSTSSLFHLFAQDAQAEKLHKNSVNSNIVSYEEDAEYKKYMQTNMNTQAPLLRAMLQDFLQYSGFGQGRLVSTDGQELLTAMSDMPLLSEIQNNTVRRAIESGKITFGSAHLVAGRLVQDFAVPLLPMLQSNEPTSIDAALLFSAPLTELLKILKDDEKNTQSHATHYILQTNDLPYAFLGSDGIHPLEQNIQSVWQAFMEETAPLEYRISIQGTEDVFSHGMHIENPNWWIITEIPKDVPDQALERIALRIILVGAILGLGFSLCLIFVWWMAMGRGQKQADIHLKSLYQTVRQQNIVLNSINMTLKDGLFMVDEKGKVLLCNQAFANIVNIKEEEDVINKDFYMLFKCEGGNNLLNEIATVLHNGNNSSFEISIKQETGNFLYRVNLCFCEGAESDSVQGVVGMISDITEFRRNALINQRMQQSITNVLVRAIESVDPYLTGHSTMMQALGELIAKHLNLDSKDTKTIDIAARLSQIGKLSLPKELWFKRGSLTDEEWKQVRHAPIFAHELLADIHSDLPIAEAVFTLSEKMDGSGYPRGLKGDAINIHARILAVLHAFCAMRSTRSWRKSMEIHQILETLRQSSAFDQEIVTALTTILNEEEALQIVRQKK